MPIRKSSKSLVNQGNTASRPSTPVNGDVYSNTETGFIEVYSSVFGWEQVGGIASTPLNLTATNIGTNRAFNNGQASIAFTPGTIAGRSYTVTSSPGGYTGTGTSSPILVSGLASNISYTYTAIATNNYGTSSASSASAGVIATTVPQAPTIGTATAGDQSATLTFTAGANGGSAITNYKYSTDNITYTAFSPAQTTSPLTISGLTNGQSYSFYLKAVNANGDSTASGISNSVAPSSSSFESIATVTVSGSSTNTITLSSIPATYKHLMIRSVTAVNSNTPSQAPTVTCNNYTNMGDYMQYYLVTQDQNNQAALGYNNDAPDMVFPIHTVGRGPTVQSDYFSGSQIWILDYANTTTFKNLLSTTGFWNTSGSGTESQSRLNISTFRKKEAINRISIFHATNFTANTQIALYGIKG